MSERRGAGLRAARFPNAGATCVRAEGARACVAWKLHFRTDTDPANPQLH